MRIFSFSIFIFTLLSWSGASRPPGFDDWDPSWSPTKDQIAFVSNRSGNSEIFLLALSDNLGIAQLTHTGASNAGPRWSPDGSQLVFYSARDGNFEIYLMSADGSNQKRLTIEPAIDWDPSWTPEGRILFESYRSGLPNLYLMDPRTGDTTRLTNDIWREAFPVWSSKENRVVFASNRDGGWDLYSLKPNGTDLKRLTESEGISWRPALSLDGRRVAFESIRGDVSDIALIGFDGKPWQWLTQDIHRDSYPNWSPDGKKIVYASQREGRWSLILKNVP